jgi:peptide deformylase
VGVALQVCVIEVDGDVHELVNPKITHLSGEQDDLEGCLSIPGFYAYRKRSEKAIVEAQNRHGRKVRLSGTGLLGRAIQHEFDHLQGELYIDKLGPDLELISVEKLREMQGEADEAGEETSAESRRLGRRVRVGGEEVPAAVE